MVTGVILGAPTLRVRGDYLAIVTLGFGEIIRITITNTGWLGASAGIKDIPSPPSIGPDPIGTDQDGLFQIPHLAWHGLTPLIDNEHKTPFLVFGVLDAVPYYWLLLTVLLIVLRRGHPDQGEPGRPRLGGHPRGRGRRGADGRADVPLQAARLRARRRHRRPGRLDAGRPGRAGSSTRPASCSCSRCCSWPRSSSAAPATGGARSSVVPWSPTCPSASAALSDWRLLIFGLALMVIVTFRPQGLLPPRRTRRAMRAEAEIEELEGEAVDA